jgi:anti-sigma regulatory factor (Ser/Thr protein kinase)
MTPHDSFAAAPSNGAPAGRRADDGSPQSPNAAGMELELRLPGGADAAAAARRALAPLERHIAAPMLNDVRLLVSELVTNSVRHAAAGPPAAVALDLRVSSRRLCVGVSDDGPGFEVERRDAGMESDSGWGLFLVDQLADRWGVESNRLTRVWFELDLPEVEAGAEPAG